MSYRYEGYYSDRQTGPTKENVPFSELTSAIGFVAEGIITGLETGQRALRRIFAAIIRQHRVNRTVGKLSALDDHILKDIGVERSSIASLARSLEDQRSFGRSDWGL